MIPISEDVKCSPQNSPQPPRVVSESEGAEELLQDKCDPETDSSALETDDDDSLGTESSAVAPALNTDQIKRLRTGA
jgi:hypothetical protein